MKRNICVFLALASMLVGCWEVDYYEEGYNDGYNDALLGGSRYSPPTYGAENIVEYRKGYFQGYADGVNELLS